MRGWKTPGADPAQSGPAYGSEHHDLQASKRKIAALEVSCNAIVPLHPPCPSDMNSGFIAAPERHTTSANKAGKPLLPCRLCRLLTSPQCEFIVYGSGAYVLLHFCMGQTLRHAEPAKLRQVQKLNANCQRCLLVDGLGQVSRWPSQLNRAGLVAHLT